jgi:hypothetical protein
MKQGLRQIDAGDFPRYCWNFILVAGLGLNKPTGKICRPAA